MKKSNIRRWLHCALDFLPLMLIPVFMIYSHRHDITERAELDVQYKYQSNEVNTFDDLVENNIYQINNLYLANDDAEFTLKIYKFSNLNLHGNGISTDDFDFSDFDINKSQMLFNFNQNAMWLQINYNDSFIAYSFTTDDELEFNNLVFSVYDNLQGFKAYCNISGIPADDFKYTDYNVIESVSLEDTKSDIMSVFTNDFYNATHKYFNMDSVINLGQIYNWFETNLFGGNVPIGIHAVWHIISYEFVMDIIFLVYSVFMFIIDFTEKFLSSMYDKSFGGGR